MHLSFIALVLFEAADQLCDFSVLVLIMKVSVVPSGLVRNQLRTPCSDFAFKVAPRPPICTGRYISSACLGHSLMQAAQSQQSRGSRTAHLLALSLKSRSPGQTLTHLGSVALPQPLQRFLSTLTGMFCHQPFRRAFDNCNTVVFMIKPGIYKDKPTFIISPRIIDPFLIGRPSCLFSV